MKNILILLLIAFFSQGLQGQFIMPQKYHTKKIVGKLKPSHKPPNSNDTIYLASSKIIRKKGANWLRLEFKDYNLGSHGFIKITSIKDNGYEILNSSNLKEVANTSAYFNGDSIRVDIYASTKDDKISVKLGRLISGDGSTIILKDTIPESICGNTDNRTRSNDAVVGRIMPVGCTGWLISSGVILTAGHCVDSNGDGINDQLQSGSLIEFNVPPSSANGNTVNSNPNDQYRINIANIRFENNGTGRDWAILTVLNNTNTQLSPFEAQRNFYRISNENPNTDASITITGFGMDNGTNNQVQQTNSGPYTGQTNNPPPNPGIYYSYQVDTRGGNSGSPIILTNNNQFTIGIHTNGGCRGIDTNISGANKGTSFAYRQLENAIQNFRNQNTLFVDTVSRSNTQNGRIFTPFRTLQGAIQNAVNNPTVSIVRGNYNENLVINKPMTLIAPVGRVVIGSNQ